MATSIFKTSTSYKPANGDFVLLAFGPKAIYDDSVLPTEMQKAAKPKEKCDKRMVFAGKIGKARVLSQAVRIDKVCFEPAEHLKKAVYEAIQAAKRDGCKRVVVPFTEESLLPSVQEGALLGGYEYDEYLSNKRTCLSVLAVTGKKATVATRKKLADGKLVCDCANFARDVLNGPPNDITPPVLAKEFAAMGKKSGLKITVWDEKRLVKEKCGGIIGVGQGAKAKPRLVIGEYSPRGAKKHIALVGKGVTFDSGGYCLKPSSSQIGMKYDMGGAAMMFGAACAIARMKLPVKVTVLTPMVENDISGEAYHTTSILTMRNGKSVEVHNTDAEGRLILADALCLAGERKPDLIIDSATLTGACVVGLGEDFSGLYGTDDKLVQKLVTVSKDAGELMWPLPLHMPYADQLRTTIADCKNIGSRWGGSITAALFLKKFVPDSIKWMHVDIAGPGCKETPLAPLGKGAKGYGVRSIAAFVREFI